MTSYLEDMIEEADALARDYDRLRSDAIVAKNNAQGGGKDFWQEHVSRYEQTALFLREARGYFIHALYHGE